MVVFHSYELFGTNVLTVLLRSTVTHPVYAAAPALAGDVIQAVCHGWAEPAHCILLVFVDTDIYK